MLLLVLMSMTVGSEPPGAGAGTISGARSTEGPALYQRPAISPFEPRSRFGRRRAEGDGETDPHRRPLIAPVGVDAYRHSYEYSPSDNETDYDQGVTQARMDARARLGGLDGVWRVTNADGDTLSDLVVSDAGDDGPIEAAWNLGRAADRAVAASVRRDGDALVIETGLGPRTARLRLERTPDGWRGDLSRNGRQEIVVLIRPPGD